jgi:hypothetical protein
MSKTLDIGKDSQQRHGSDDDEHYDKGAPWDRGQSMPFAGLVR